MIPTIIPKSKSIFDTNTFNELNKPFRNALSPSNYNHYPATSIDTTNNSNSSNQLNLGLYNRQNKITNQRDEAKGTPKSNSTINKSTKFNSPREANPNISYCNSLTIQQLPSRGNSVAIKRPRPPLCARDGDKERLKTTINLAHSSSKSIIGLGMNNDLNDSQNTQLKEFRIKTRVQKKSINYSAGSGGSLLITEIDKEDNNSSLGISCDDYSNIRMNSQDHNNKDSELIASWLNIVTGPRIYLPLLIIHFEGLLGTCSYYAQQDNMIEYDSQFNKKNIEKLTKDRNNILFRPGLKKDMRLMAKSFIVVVVFPSAAERYKNAMKYILKNKISIDGAYYCNLEAEETKYNKYILNYNPIIEDFKLKPNHKTIIFKPIDLPVKQIKANMHIKTMVTPGTYLETSAMNMMNNKVFQFKIENKSEDSCLHKLFPKIDIRVEKLRLCLFSNFLLDDKNIKSPLNSIHETYQFNNLLKTALKIAKEEFIECFNFGMSEVDNKSSDKMIIPLTQIDTNTPLKEKKANEINIMVTNNCIYDKENKENIMEIIRKGANEKELTKKYFEVDLRSVFSIIEETITKLKFLNDVKYIKKKNAQSGKRGGLIDMMSIKNRVVDEILYQARQKGISKNVMSHFVVGDLFMRNADIMKIYEKSEFYNHTKHTQNITEIMRLRKLADEMKENGGGDESIITSTNTTTRMTDQPLSPSSYVAPVIMKQNKQKNIEKFEMNIIKKYARNFFICLEE